MDILSQKCDQYRWATQKHFHTTKFFYAKFCSNVKKILRPQPYKGFSFPIWKKSYKNKVPRLGFLALVDLSWQCGYTTKVQKIPA
jgi:ribosomal protein L33